MVDEAILAPTTLSKPTVLLTDKALVIFATFVWNNNYFILKTLPIRSESSAISSHSCSSPSSCSFASVTSMFSSLSAANFLACSSN